MTLEPHKAFALSSSQFLQVASLKEPAVQVVKSPWHILLLGTLAAENQTQNHRPKRGIDSNTVYAEQMAESYSQNGHFL